jgi:hypothetical protein
MKKKIFYFLVFATLLFNSCSDKEYLTMVTAEELNPLQVGKVFIYKLDSTVLANFNQSLVVHSYIAKDSVESTFIDAEGKKSFRIFRYLRDTLQTKPWKYTATYITSFTNNRVEYIDNNLRFVSLVSPVRESIQWNGTQYINTISPSPYSFFSNWNFEYTNSDEPFTTLKGTIPNTYTVFQQDETLPNIPFNSNNYQEKSYSKEVYAKGVGLVYKEFLRWVHQPPTAVNKYFQEGSFGIKLNLIDYR